MPPSTTAAVIAKLSDQTIGRFYATELISSDEFNVSDVKVVWYKNGTHKTRRRNI